MSESEGSGERAPGSIFAALRPAEPPPPLPPPSPAPAPRPEPTVDPPPPASAEGGLAKRVEELEAELRKVSEQAVAAMVTLREREQAQREAHRQAEATLEHLSVVRQGEELNRQLRERVGALEDRLVETASRTGAGAVEAIEERMARLEANVLSLQGALARRASVEAASALEMELSRLESRTLDRLRELRSTLEAAVALRLAELREALDRDMGAWEASLPQRLREAVERVDPASDAALADLRSIVERQGRRLDEFAAATEAGLHQTARALRDEEAGLLESARLFAKVQKL